MNNRIDAIYARQSVDKKDSISIESQIEFCKYELKGGNCKEYTDKGYSCLLYTSSRQGVYESPRSSSHAGLRDKMSRTCGHTHKKANRFFSQNWNRCV